MEYVDLESGFALLGFGEYPEYKRVKQLCVEKYKRIAYAGDFSRIKEIQAKAWVRLTSSGYMDYHHPLQAYIHHRSIERPKGHHTALPALHSAVDVLSGKTGQYITYVIIIRR